MVLPWCHAAFKASPCSDQNFSKSCGGAHFWCRIPWIPRSRCRILQVLLTSIGHLEANGLHKDLATGKPGDAGNIILERCFYLFGMPILPIYMCMNCCGFTAWYLSNLPYISVARTCVFSYVNQCFTMLLGTSRPSTCRILTQVSLPQSDCFSLSCLAEPQACKSQWYSLPFFLSTKSWKPFSKSQIPCKKVSFFAA